MRRIDLNTATDEQLLATRLCDLPLTADAPFIAKHIRRLHRELARRGLRFKPHVWLADEWFSVDGVPGFAAPFDLAHPRLLRLQRRMMGEAEGGNSNWMMRILRHEAAHAYDNAFRLRRRKSWRAHFGKASTPYPTRYRPNARSRDYVLHLGAWYAQSHPAEDFAETFAVILQPRAAWRRTYADSPRVLAKLHYVRELCEELRGRQPSIASRALVEPLASNRRTLSEHYERAARRQALEQSRQYDRWLKQAFPSRSANARLVSAAQALRRERDALVRRLSEELRLHPYHVRNVLRAVIARCDALDLRATGDRRKSARKARSMMKRLLRAQFTVDSAHRSRQQYAV